MRSARFIWILLSFGVACTAQTRQRQVAITIDDLPVAQSGDDACQYDNLRRLTSRLLDPIQKEHVPVTGFVIGSRCAELPVEQRRQILELWLASGAELGNHTYSHHGLNQTPIEEHEQDILRGDAALTSLLDGRKPRYFRSPMLQTGVDRTAKERLEAFLAAHGYTQAIVTLDNSDWMLAFVYSDALRRGNAALARRVRDAYIPYLESVIGFFERRSVEVVGREFPQVMLMHANALNAEMMPALLEMFRKRGYRFVSLEEALRDPAYQLPNEYAGRGGFSWIHRWSFTKGMPKKGEPDEPSWIRAAYEALTASR